MSDLVGNPEDWFSRNENIVQISLFGNLMNFFKFIHQINSNTFITIIDVYETLCLQQMLVHKGGKIKNWDGECRDVTPTKSLSQNIRVDVNREVKFL